MAGYAWKLGTVRVSNVPTSCLLRPRRAVPFDTETQSHYFNGLFDAFKAGFPPYSSISGSGSHLQAVSHRADSMTDNPPKPEPPSPPERSSPENLVSFLALTNGAREVMIEYEGQRYRLRATKNGKLLLNK